MDINALTDEILKLDKDKANEISRLRWRIRVLEEKIMAARVTLNDYHDGANPKYYIDRAGMFLK